MNDLKEKEEQVKKYLTFQLNELYESYDQEIDADRFKKTFSIISKELINKHNLYKINLDNAFRELLYNYTYYKRINAASYLTAFEKSNKK